jgi:hypothetical protein
LYGTVHKKNNQLYNFFCFWFLCLLVGVFNLYSTDIYIYIYFSFYITIVVHLYGTAHGKVFVYIDDFFFFFLYGFPLARKVGPRLIKRFSNLYLQDSG